MIDRKEEIEAHWQQNAKAAFDEHGMYAFQKWFDNGDDLDHINMNGHVDLWHRIYTPDVAGIINKNPNQISALEIGCGGGRMTVPASMLFKKVYAVDILPQNMDL